VKVIGTDWTRDLHEELLKDLNRFRKYDLTKLRDLCMSSLPPPSSLLAPFPSHLLSLLGSDPLLPLPSSFLPPFPSPLSLSLPLLSLSLPSPFVYLPSLPSPSSSLPFLPLPYPLVRVIRNKAHHYRDLPPALQEELGDLPAGFLNYFSEIFPKLIPYTFDFAMQECKNDKVFENYFRTETRF
jgi:hypothetical protein